MKTETQIAQENIKELKNLESGDFDGQAPLKRMSDFLELKKQSLTHKQTLQRFLEFLEKMDSELANTLADKKGEIEDLIWKNIHGKFITKLHTDITNAIKLYEEAGI